MGCESKRTSVNEKFPLSLSAVDKAPDPHRLKGLPLAPEVHGSVAAAELVEVQKLSLPSLIFSFVKFIKNETLCEFL